MFRDDARCDEIHQWLQEQGSEKIPVALSGHVENCHTCQEQVTIHQSLVAVFSEEAVPELSVAFNGGLEKKLLTARTGARRLAGWRMAAMLGYAVVAIGILGWALRDIPLPAIDMSAPWVPVVAFLAVPLTLSLAAMASRWLPAPTGKSQQQALAL